jgi:ANTAR domain-containing protein/GAF domain-containing protein
MTDPEFLRVLVLLEECRDRIGALTAGAAAPLGGELSEVRDQLDSAIGELRALRPAQRRSAPTPATLRRLLTLAREDLAEQLTARETPLEQLTTIVSLAKRVVPGTEHATVSVIRDVDEVETLASTSSLGTAADGVQGDLQEGPAFQVGEQHGTLRIVDLRHETRWPKYTARLQELGLRSVLACELPLTGQPGGVLTLYSARRQAFRDAAELVVPVFAARASIALVHADRVLNLRRAIGTRQVIGEAVGILMERHRISAEDAFERLVSASQNSHVKLRELAMRVTETGEEPDDAAREGDAPHGTHGTADAESTPAS